MIKQLSEAKIRNFYMTLPRFEIEKGIALTRDFLQKSQRYTLEQVQVWRLQSCPHFTREENIIKGGCGQCWQELKREK